ncbi:hypothetical protein I4641_15830 [Waterburya agarophytonicola K14]|uniref:Uncharacterized protein n=1 Tax=Waterburya agarophytonicola KI4 TaxID=2874699 RepID=A0A964BTB0_9CYAN|nr:hypothetical protein [Waterburya agarophytonicola]MCC0178446.1 hypothetical protein [Waterburya agarophytonicola KI4]
MLSIRCGTFQHVSRRDPDNAVNTHHQKGESIAVSDKNGKVKIVSAQEIPEFKKRLDKE